MPFKVSQLVNEKRALSVELTNFPKNAAPLAEIKPGCLALYKQLFCENFNVCIGSPPFRFAYTKVLRNLFAAL